MGDSYGDGWNGNILGIKQNGQIVATFGEAMATGSSATSLIQIAEDVNSEIVVHQFGTWTEEISFTIKDPEGNVLASRAAGTGFSANAVLGYFCYKCTSPPMATYFLTLTDSYGDGWNGNQLYLDYQGQRTILGADFANGNAYGPSAMQFAPG